MFASFVFAKIFEKFANFGQAAFLTYRGHTAATPLYPGLKPAAVLTAVVIRDFVDTPTVQFFVNNFTNIFARFALPFEQVSSFVYSVFAFAGFPEPVDEHRDCDEAADFAAVFAHRVACVDEPAAVWTARVVKDFV